MIIIFILTLILVFLFILRNYLIKQTKAYVDISKHYTELFMSCQMSFEEYKDKQTELKEGISPLLKMYMKKEGIILG